MNGDPHMPKNEYNPYEDETVTDEMESKCKEHLEHMLAQILTPGSST
jgi:hypothetical protein